MANTTNFGWETPDDTDLVKDGAAAIRTLGSAIDTSLVDLKGGTTGQTLTKNSNTDMDFVWSTASASGEGWALVANGSLTSGASLALTGLGAYDKYMLLMSVFRPGAATDTYTLRVNNDSGSNYRFSRVTTWTTSTNNGLGSAQTSAFGTFDMTNGDNAGYLIFNITGCKSTTAYKRYFGSGLVTNQSPYVDVSFGGVWESNSAVTSLDVAWAAQSFANGTYRLYGSN